jgi:hypothetical protein
MKMRNDVRLETCITAARLNGAAPATVSLEGHLRELERIKERCLAVGNHQTALQAEIARGKAAGLYIERTQEVPAADPIMVLRKLRATKGGEPLARALAEQHGIPWSAVEGKVIALRAVDAPAVPNEPEEPEQSTG